MTCPNACRAWEIAIRRGYSKTETLVYMALADHANRDTMESWPSIDRLAVKARGSDRAVRLALKRLQADGTVEVLARPNKTNVYKVHLPEDDAPLPVVASKPAATPPAPVPAAPPLPSLNLFGPPLDEPGEALGVKNVSPQGGNIDTPKPLGVKYIPLQGGNIDYPNPSLNPPEEEERTFNCVERVEPDDVRTCLFREGVPIVRRLTGKGDGAARGIIGRVLKDARDDCAKTLAALYRADDARPIDLVPWLRQAVGRSELSMTDQLREELGMRGASVFDAWKDREEAGPVINGAAIHAAPIVHLPQLRIAS